ncbi:GNAT family N-acetyltransferase [Desemzia sp. FAM 23991]|uniref:GNAT family N-acetyltransferase n=1 Tax=unclassified Desemzia TaxID=2685243 RepID=UPI0038893814
MEFEKGDNRFYKNDESGKMIAEITYIPSGEDKVLVDHTFVDPSLRGQGVAEQLVDRTVQEMETEGKKMVAVCPYVVSLFERKSDKYQDIIAK